MILEIKAEGEKEKRLYRGACNFGSKNNLYLQGKKSLMR
jgi:hypothetical protein